MTPLHKMRMKAQDEILVSCSKRITLKKRSGIFRIDPHGA
jgi:hypothetical protein